MATGLVKETLSRIRPGYVSNCGDRWVQGEYCPARDHIFTVEAPALYNEQEGDLRAV